MRFLEWTGVGLGSLIATAPALSVVQAYSAEEFIGS